MNTFDYSQNFIHYKEKVYPFRKIWFDNYNQDVIVSVTSLNDDVFDERGNWTDSLAEYIDSKIIYYVSEQEISRSAKYLQNLLKMAIV